MEAKAAIGAAADLTGDAQILVGGGVQAGKGLVDILGGGDGFGGQPLSLADQAVTVLGFRLCNCGCELRLRAGDIVGEIGNLILEIDAVILVLLRARRCRLTRTGALETPQLGAALLQVEELLAIFDAARFQVGDELLRGRNRRRGERGRRGPGNECRRGGHGAELALGDVLGDGIGGTLGRGSCVALGRRGRQGARAGLLFDLKRGVAGVVTQEAGRCSAVERTGRGKGFDLFGGKDAGFVRHRKCAPEWRGEKSIGSGKLISKNTTTRGYPVPRVLLPGSALVLRSADAAV